LIKSLLGFAVDATSVSSVAADEALSKCGPIVIAALVPAILLDEFPPRLRVAKNQKFIEFATFGFKGNIRFAGHR